MITFANSCYCSQLKVIPKNWKTSKNAVKEEWMVYYRFYDYYFLLAASYKAICDNQKMKDYIHLTEQSQTFMFNNIGYLKR